MNSIVPSENTLHVSALRRLTLIASELDWTLSFLCGLTHLKIGGCISEPSDARNFLRALPEMTLLESLDLDDTIEFASAVPSRLSSLRSENLISIPTLMDLRIDASIENVAAFLSILVFPSTVNLLLNTFHEGEEEDGIVYYFEILLALENLFTMPISPLGSQNHIQSCRIIQGTSDFRFQAFRSILTQDELLTWTRILTSNTPLPSIDCTFTFEFEMYPPRPLAHRLMDVFWLDHVVTLQVVGDLLFVPDDWAERFGRMAGLRSLLLGNNAVPYYLFWALTLENMDMPFSGNPSEGVPKTLLFPVLDTILVHCYNRHSSHTRFLEEYARLLHLRRNIGFPFFELSLLTVRCVKITVGCTILGRSSNMWRS